MWRYDGITPLDSYNALLTVEPFMCWMDFVGIMTINLYYISSPDTAIMHVVQFLPHETQELFIICSRQFYLSPECKDMRGAISSRVIKLILPECYRILYPEDLYNRMCWARILSTLHLDVGNMVIKMIIYKSKYIKKAMSSLSTMYNLCICFQFENARKSK